MPNYAVIDVGSNSIRLVVYSVPNDRRATYARSDFSSIANDKVMAGLAAYVSPDGIFTQAGVKKASSTIKAHLKHASYFKCKRVSVFATAVLRNAANSAEVIGAIEENANCKIDLISGKDEALLGFAGASSERMLKDGVAVDIGGGSTELTLIKDGSAVQCESIPQGSLSSYANHVKGVLPTGGEIADICRTFDINLNSNINPAEYLTDTLYGIGGSVRATAKMLAMQTEDRVRPKTFGRSDVNRILNLCVNDPSSYAHQALTAAPERVHTLTPGCAILSEVMRQTKGESIRVCKCGIREGYLITRMLEAQVRAVEN